MTLEIKSLTPGSPYYQQVLDLYQTAFPAVERLPLAWLEDQLDSQQAEWLVYFDGEDFLGFSYSLLSHKVYYLLFLAVSPSKRSQGFGTKILDQVSKRAGNRLRVLVIEPLHEKAENYNQRLKRLAFYQRNGYQLTPYYYYEDQEAYQVLSHGDLDQLADFVELASLIETAGIKIKVTKQQE